MSKSKRKEEIEEKLGKILQIMDDVSDEKEQEAVQLGFTPVFAQLVKDTFEHRMTDEQKSILTDIIED